MVICSIKRPVSIITNKELPFIDCLNILFSELTYLLCRWHVNINVLAKTKKHFLGLIKDAYKKVKRHPFF